jgi:hypothetical protein
MLESKCLLLFSIALLLTSPIATSAESWRGDEFVTLMDGNTLSGSTAAGLAFNLYFLASGQVTYANIAGQRVSGAWHLDRNGDVCITWSRRVEAFEGCFRMYVDGDRIIWRSERASGRGVLRGGVTDSFLKHAP